MDKDTIEKWAEAQGWIDILNLPGLKARVSRLRPSGYVFATYKKQRGAFKGSALQGVSSLHEKTKRGIHAAVYTKRS